jgi:hypothetical protein
MKREGENCIYGNTENHTYHNCTKKKREEKRTKRKRETKQYTKTGKKRKEDERRRGAATEPRPKASLIQSTSSYIISLRSTVILSSHLHLGLPSDFFP